MRTLLEQNNASPSIGLELERRRSWLSTIKEPGLIAFFIALFGVMSVFGATYMGIAFMAPVFVLAFGVPLLIFSCVNLHIGVFMLFTISYFLLGIMRWVWMIGPIPTGTLMDLLLVIFLISMIVSVGRNGSWEFAKNPISFLIMIWIGYNLGQALNPESVSPEAWLISVRSMAVSLLLYFIAAYAFKTFGIVNTFVQLWIFLSLLLAIYGIVQEKHGLFDFEMNWVRQDEQRVALFFIGGKWRKFSFFCDPTTFGLVAAYSALLCFILALGPVSFIKKIYYVVSGLLMVLGMLYSGTRTAYVLIPIGIAFLAVLTLQRNLIIFCILFFIVGGGIVLGPVNSLGPLDANTLNRLRSAFNPEKDASFQVRLKNQAFIKPYIHSHPIGSGLGAVGDFGTKYHSPLGGFDTDSGFVRIAVELGWVGLLLFGVLLFMVFKMGIENYHSLKDPLHKNFQAAILCVVFSIVVCNYAQEAINQYPSSIIFFACMAIVTVMPNFEKNES